MVRLFLYILIFFSTNLFAFKQINISENFRSIPLGKYIDIYEDSKKALDISNIQSSNILWFNSDKENPGFGFTDSTYWVKFKIHNDTQKFKQMYIEINYPMIDRVEIFIPQNNSTFKSIVGGDVFPFKQRIIDYKHIVFPIELEANQESIYYLRFSTESAMNINLVLHNSHPFMDYIIYDQVAHGFYFGILLIMIFYNVFIYGSTKDRNYLYLVLFVASYGMSMFTLRGYSFQFLWTDWIWWANNNLPIFIYLACIWGIFYSRRFLGTKINQPYIERLFIISFLLNSIGLISCFFLRYSTNIKYASIMSIITSIICLSSGIRSAIQKTREGYYYLFAWSFVLVGIILFALKTFAILPSNPVTTWSVLVGSSLQVLFFSLGLADKVNTMKKELEELNISLENKVEKRTEILQRSLNEIRELKETQDGDYFLTSLLLKPLNEMKANSVSVRIDYILKQKKNFRFKKFTSEIGGDICSSNTIILNQKKYIVFINGDAMGKSIQGAGGAIVIGTAFKTIITRTQQHTENTITPEKWLEDVFYELQNIFISFDGTMLVSAIFGLIDDEIGLLHYINSEHPYMVLYRDKKASFIDDKEMVTRKIGFTIPMEQTSLVQSFWMQHLDSIIIGSDGRDDLAISTNSKGQRVINENEKLFLNVVEQADGDLNEIQKKLSELGEITDDLSLMKFYYI